MIKRITNYLLDLRDRQRISIALSKGAAMLLSRTIDKSRPTTWEFSGFSQNGEDGIIDVLRKELKHQNRYFIEIGAADGIESNSGWLVVAEQYAGLMVEGNPKLVERAQRTVVRHSIGAESHCLFMTAENVGGLKRLALYDDPDIFSIDVDGNDYYLARAVLEAGFRPKIFVVEYNSVFGPDRTLTIHYLPDFYFKAAHPTHLYYGVSIAGWKSFFATHGYRFVTVDRNGVNAFFVDPDLFDGDFLSGIESVHFAENRHQQAKFRKTWPDQFLMIEDQSFVTI